ncbi:MAG: hypothetical protein NW224_24115 [Leptolyngbyaceae cyanobacterium bins.302]|nr:hypothetical protein [Leptolyngbyaceae cyanobacterium bins.302]
MTESMELHYSILIQWSDENLELLIEAYREQGRSLPQPAAFEAG